MKIVHRKRALHQKKLLRFTDNGAKIALVKRNSNRNLVLEGCRPCPLFGASLTMRQSGMHKIENPSISGTHFF